MSVELRDMAVRILGSCLTATRRPADDARQHARAGHRSVS
jgi:hypothetical protein